MTANISLRKEITTSYNVSTMTRKSKPYEPSGLTSSFSFPPFELSKQLRDLWHYRMFTSIFTRLYGFFQEIELLFFCMASKLSYVHIIDVTTILCNSLLDN